jgi:hypothetical protein
MIVEKTVKRDAQGRLVGVIEHHHVGLGEFVESCHAQLVEHSRRQEIRRAGWRELTYQVDLTSADDYWIDPPKLLQGLLGRLAGDLDLWNSMAWTRVYIAIKRDGHCVAHSYVTRSYAAPARAHGSNGTLHTTR